MHCPNCGTPASADQRFCRSCGLTLPEFSQLLAEKLPTLRAELQYQKRKIERWGVGLWIGAGAIFYVSLYWAIISEIIIGKGHVLGGILFLLVITAISLGALLIFYSSSLEKRSASSQANQSQSKGDTAPELLQGSLPELTISITEHTTELLENDDLKHSEAQTIEKLIE
jgi:uncharacterized membrane protein